MQPLHCDSFEVDSPNVTYTDEYITSTYKYDSTEVEMRGGKAVAVPKSVEYQFRTERKPPKVGLMLVGWGGNNGSTCTAGVLANKHKMSWETKEGKHDANYFGSLTQASTCRLGGSGPSHTDVFVPFSALLPMVNPNDLVIGGWDISSTNLADAMTRSKVLDVTLQQQLRPLMQHLKPLPSVYYPDFIAANQSERADNVLPGQDKQKHLDQVRKDIRDFKAQNKLCAAVRRKPPSAEGRDLRLTRPPPVPVEQGQGHRAVDRQHGAFRLAPVGRQRHRRQPALRHQGQRARDRAVDHLRGCLHPGGLDVH